MAAYPKQLRARVVAAAEQGEYIIAEIANTFSVGVTFVKKMLKLHREGEDLAPRHGGWPVRLLGEKELALLRNEIKERADTTLDGFECARPDRWRYNDLFYRGDVGSNAQARRSSLYG